MRKTLITAALVLCGLLSGCASSLPPNANFEVLTQAYQLDSGDELRVTVFEQDNLSENYSVDQAGFITMPLIGTVPARGKTTTQLSGEVAKRLKEGFVRNPDVAIEVATFRPFFIHGEVTNAGQYEYVNGLTAQTAIAIAGGYSARANKQFVVISRQLNGKIAHGKVGVNAPIRPGDTITVKERLF